ncbi:MAG: glycosyl hydrolase family 28-related protein [Candidatus Margulisiibacteriota bacterium]
MKRLFSSLIFAFILAGSVLAIYPNEAGLRHVPLGADRAANDARYMFKTATIETAAYSVLSGTSSTCSGALPVYNVKNYGAVGDTTTDDTAAIKAAIAAAKADGGGTVYFPVGGYKITETLTIDAPVRLVGNSAGSAEVFTPVNSIPFFNTYLHWQGATRETMVRFRHVFSDKAGIENLCFYGADRAGVILDLTSASNGNYKGLYIFQPLTAGIMITSEGVAAGGVSSWNVFERINIISTTTEGKACLWLTGSGGCNACHNSFINLQLTPIGSQHGILLGYCDNNNFSMVWINGPGSGTGYGVYADPTEVATFPHNNAFFQLQPGNGWYQPAGTTKSPASIWGYMTDNAQPQAITNGTPLDVHYGSFNGGGAPIVHNSTPGLTIEAWRVRVVGSVETTGGFVGDGSRLTGVPAVSANYATLSGTASSCSGNALTATTATALNASNIYTATGFISTDLSTLDGVTIQNGGALTITGGTNTFNLTNGTASLDIATAKTVDVNANVTITNNFTNAYGTFTPTVELVGGTGNVVPVYSTATGRWDIISRQCHIQVQLSGDGGDEGAGTGVVNVHLPFTVAAHRLRQTVGRAVNNSAYYTLWANTAATATKISLIIKDANADTITNFKGSDQNATDRAIDLDFWMEI